MKTRINGISLGTGMFLMLISFPSTAQISGGILGGVSTGAVKIEHVDRGFTDVIQGKNILGIEGGLFLKCNAGPVYAKPMAIYSYQSGDITFEDQKINYRADKFGLPVMFGLNLPGPFAIEGGPVYSYVVDVTQDYNSDRMIMAKNGLGYRAGLALDFGPLIINATYEGMTYHSGDSGKTEFKEPSKLIFGAALKFGGGTKKVSPL